MFINRKKKLSDVTLVAMTSVKVPATVKAMLYSMRGIEFGDVVFISHKKPWWLSKKIRFSYTSELKCIDDFNYKMVYELGEHIKTKYALIVHYDGFVVNPDMWEDSFLNYDYIGSPWPLPDDDDKVSFRDINGNLCRVGNSVSIRSKRLMDLPTKLSMKWEAFGGWYNEDGYICCNNRHVFEQNGMIFAPLDIAVRFGHETMLPETFGIRPFVFHKWAGTNARYPKFTNIPLWPW